MGCGAFLGQSEHNDVDSKLQRSHSRLPPLLVIPETVLAVLGPEYIAAHADRAASFPQVERVGDLDGVRFDAHEVTLCWAAGNVAAHARGLPRHCSGPCWRNCLEIDR